MTEPCVQVVSKINKCIELSMPSVFDIVITIETIKSLNDTFIYEITNKLFHYLFT